MIPIMTQILIRYSLNANENQLHKLTILPRLHPHGRDKCSEEPWGLEHHGAEEWRVDGEEAEGQGARAAARRVRQAWRRKTRQRWRPG
jgi:hypothetical protein